MPFATHLRSTPSQSGRKRRAVILTSTPTIMTTSSHIDLLHYWFDQVWNKNNLSVVDELMASNVVFGGPLQTLMSPGQDYKELVQMLKALLQDFHVSVTHAIAQNDMASARVVVSRVGPGINDPMTFSGQLMVRVRDGKFVEFLSNFDYLQMYENLGQLPPDALAITLTGERLTWTD